MHIFRKKKYPIASDFKKALLHASKTKVNLAEAKTYQIIGATFIFKGAKNLDSALVYSEKALISLNKIKHAYVNSIKKELYFNLGKIHYEKKEFSKAIIFFKKALKEV